MKKYLFVALFVFVSAFTAAAQKLVSLDGSAVTVRLDDGRQMTFDFYGPDIVRVFLDPDGGQVRDPEAVPPAKILTEDPRRDAGAIKAMNFGDDGVWINSEAVDLVVASDGSFRFRHHQLPTKGIGSANEDIWRQVRIDFAPTGTSLSLPGNEQADYYGGGIQNGRYRHNGRTIAIENQNSWTDGGVCSPAPWFWCTDGYGILWHTFAKGSYAFGKEVSLQHETSYLDIFLMIAPDPLQYAPLLEQLPEAEPRGFLEKSGKLLADLPARMLNLYYQLTGNPVLLPKFGFYEGHLNARPFIITLDGWAGTQRFAGVWSGDQVGGNWEYIRFHIPTYICAGLSGQPNIISDMDGIFGGKNETVNIRDFQWKTFTPMQLDMDGWGANEKYPQALGTRAADITRRYLKLKSELMPYAYSIAHEAVTGLPMIRPMEFEDPAAKQVATSKYQFLYGPSLLVAPIYQETAADEEGNDIRDGIYLPDGLWLDYFTSEAYLGGKVLNGFYAPLDKLPVFMRSGAIIPMTLAHNNPSQQNKSLRIYDIAPCYGKSSFTEYDDDGRTMQYLSGAFCTTQISSEGLDTGDVVIRIEPTQGSFEGMITQKGTLLRIRTEGKPKKIRATIGGKKVHVVPSYDPACKTLSLMLPFCDITASAIEVTLKGFKGGVFNEKGEAVEKL